MSIATRAATCTSCSKRLNRKSWYYRNGKYFCKQRCWDAEVEKMAKEAGEKAEKAKEANAAKEKAEQAAKAAPAAESAEKS